MKVGEVGERTGLSRKALRHYESLGLVEPAVRRESGYRLYAEEALRRIELVRRAKTLGLALRRPKSSFMWPTGAVRCSTGSRARRASTVARRHCAPVARR